MLQGFRSFADRVSVGWCAAPRARGRARLQKLTPFAIDCLLGVPMMDWAAAEPWSKLPFAASQLTRILRSWIWVLSVDSSWTTQREMSALCRDGLGD